MRKWLSGKRKFFVILAMGVAPSIARGDDYFKSPLAFKIVEGLAERVMKETVDALKKSSSKADSLCFGSLSPVSFDLGQMISGAKGLSASYDSLKAKIKALSGASEALRGYCVEGRGSRLQVQETLRLIRDSSREIRSELGKNKFHGFDQAQLFTPDKDDLNDNPDAKRLYKSYLKTLAGAMIASNQEYLYDALARDVQLRDHVDSWDNARSARCFDEYAPIVAADHRVLAQAPKLLPSLKLDRADAEQSDQSMIEYCLGTPRRTLPSKEFPAGFETLGVRAVRESHYARAKAEVQGNGTDVRAQILKSEIHMQKERRKYDAQGNSISFQLDSPDADFDPTMLSRDQFLQFLLEARQAPTESELTLENGRTIPDFWLDLLRAQRDQVLDEAIGKLRKDELNNRAAWAAIRSTADVSPHQINECGRNLSSFLAPYFARLKSFHDRMEYYHRMQVAFIAKLAKKIKASPQGKELIDAAHSKCATDSAWVAHPDEKKVLSQYQPEIRVQAAVVEARADARNELPGIFGDHRDEVFEVHLALGRALGECKEPQLVGCTNIPSNSDNRLAFRSCTSIALETNEAIGAEIDDSAISPWMKVDQKAGSDQTMFLDLPAEQKSCLQSDVARDLQKIRKYVIDQVHELSVRKPAPVVSSPVEELLQDAASASGE